MSLVYQMYNNYKISRMKFKSVTDSNHQHPNKTQRKWYLVETQGRVQKCRAPNDSMITQCNTL